MLNLERLFRRGRKKRDRADNANLPRDLTFALVVKFFLLGILWWIFFAGKKVPVDAGKTAHALLNAPMNHVQETPR
jgi:cbb3-type cytochrome oxidase subunit 3